MAQRDLSLFSRTEASAQSGATRIVPVTDGRALIPSAEFLTTADYKRLGGDLLLEDAEGGRVLVRDYFETDQPADLVTLDGAAIPGDLAVRLAGTLAPGQYAQAGRGAGVGQPIGNVETVAGQVQVTHADGSKAILAKGAAVFQGDVLQTPQGASVGILFIDKTSLSLGANGRMVLDQMVYDPSAQTGKSAFSLVSGTFSFVSGQISKTEPDAMVVRTPVATMGIRGTLGTAGYSAQSGLTAAILPEGGQTVGEMSITNGSGTQVINQPNTGLQVASFFTPPSLPVAVSPGFMAANFGAVLNVLPPTPISPTAVSTVQQTIAGTPSGSPSSGPGGMQGGMSGPAAPVGPQGPGAQGPAPQGGGPQGAMGPGGPGGPDAGMGMAAMGGPGAPPQAAFAAAAQAAMNAAIASGATIEQAQAAALQVQQAFQNALAGGANPQQALLAAGQAAAQVGLLGPAGGVGMGGMGGAGGANPFAVVAAGGTVAPVSALTGAAVPPGGPGVGVPGGGGPGLGGPGGALGMSGVPGGPGGPSGPEGPGGGAQGGGDPQPGGGAPIFAPPPAPSGFVTAGGFNPNAGGTNPFGTGLPNPLDPGGGGAQNAYNNIFGQNDFANLIGGSDGLGDDFNEFLNSLNPNGGNNDGGNDDGNDDPIQNFPPTPDEGGGGSGGSGGSGSTQDEIADADPGIATSYLLAVGGRFVGTMEAGGVGSLRGTGDGDAVKMELEGGVTYIMEARGDYFGALPSNQHVYGGTQDDPYLHLLDSSGTDLSSNDDGGGGFNAVIVYTPGSTGDYFLHMTPYASGEDGTYTLSLREGVIVDNGLSAFDGDALGGTGADTVFVQDLAATLDLATGGTSGGVVAWTNIERVDLSLDYPGFGNVGGNDVLTLNWGDVMRATDADHRLQIIGDGNDTVNLDNGGGSTDGWIFQGKTTIEGESYSVYFQNGATVDIQDGTGTVNIQTGAV